MNAPKTYFEWKNILDQFSCGDDSVLPIMHEGEMKMDAGTAMRFANLVDQTYRKRKQIWVDKFNGLFKSQIIKNSSGFGVILNQTKGNLRLLIQFTQLAPFSTDLKKMLAEDLENYIQQIKKSIKDDLYKNRTSEMNSLLIIFDNLDVNKISIVNKSQDTVSAPDSNLPGKRRIIF